MLKLDNVSKTYRTGTFGGKQLCAVRDVTFEIKDGEVVSLIGESGSGKSTIGKMILRLIAINEGTITFDGLDVGSLKRGDLREYYRKVQGVFQDPFSSYNPIFKADRVFEVMHDHFYRSMRQKEWTAKIHDSLESVGLNPEHVLGKYPHQLSGGQLQRFLIARALLLEIRFLVADEIISMLDASTRIDVLNLLADLKERDLGVLFITHDLSLGYYISEQAAILYRGCIVEMGQTEKIYDNPIHPYTRMLMASVPRLDKKWEDVEIELRAKQGQLSDGCVYFERCPEHQRQTCCRDDRPTLRLAEEGHFVACQRSGKEESS
ncbi:MAG: ABC transporter ATP-binding protein [Candidatus Atribacteria bacterium]|nr:MAG: ABC transporter ATP-binding protein [Candidatus Atribacteria bacterium]